ncbi:cytochrome P450 [Amycolatopsis sp. NPDC051903]|uniref:cytochrome P450 n=1 Tax=Amycolatopsis sp. NPDC051903 TaxID=3363936 RepID=UPI0037937577
MAEIVQRLWRHFARQVPFGMQAPEFFAELAEQAPVVRFDGMWVISGYDLVTRLCTQPGFPMAAPVFPEAVHRDNPQFVRFFSSTMSVRAAEEHQRLRSVLTGAFSGRRLAALRDRIDDVVAELLAEPLRRGEAEFVGELATPLPARVTAVLLGVPPADREFVTERATGMMNQLAAGFLAETHPEAGPPITAAEFAELREYVTGLLEQRRAEPAEDLIGHLAGSYQAGKLSAGEAVDMVLLLFMTGLDTVTAALANTLVVLSERPEIAAALAADPACADRVFAEALRLRTPVAFGSRQVAHDLSVGKLHFKAGDTVILAFAAANLDPRKFEAPLEFRWDRPITGNVAFGHGSYYCLGSALAGMTALSLLQAVHDRLPTPSRPLAELPWRASLAFPTPRVLPVTFSPALAESGAR